ncbi:uncharacterized protein EAF02_002636 [Botrytis sinoallii]|uniref:uncharacterized protein n=1 Tax=Botrytis sinoallii TaxID=1463999 RepID=UPI0019003DD6|nr:uncharacterized protein EAF02_002636 [Botrytis sinoallii]KAF7888095.1 hypothetical protein EAF02_002636 [Botrytis sinoallii]
MDQPGTHNSLAEPTNNNLESKYSNQMKFIVDGEPQDPSLILDSSRNSLRLTYGCATSSNIIMKIYQQSDLTARALFEYKLLCAVVFSNPAAVFLLIFTNAKRNSRQIRDVTGMDLAQIHRAHFYLWVNIALWILVECVVGIGMAIALNLLISEITLISMRDICL